MFLKPRDLENFSINEQSIIDIIGKNTMTLSQVAEVLYKDVKIKPLYPTTVVSNAIKRINLKAEMYQLNFRIKLVGNLGRSGRKATLVRSKA